MPGSRRRWASGGHAVKLRRPAALLTTSVSSLSNHDREQSMSYVIPVWNVPSLPIAGRGERFPVRHVYCVGRNYAEHAKEMGGDATKEPPFFFTKPADAVVPVVAPEVGNVHYPSATKNYQHELELVVAIGTAAANLSAEAAPIGPVYPVTQVGHPSHGQIALDVNGEPRQRGDLADMIWDVPHVLHFLSQYYELLPGDLVFTGTPSGVAAVVAGDELVGRIEGLGSLSVRIVAPR